MVIKVRTTADSEEESDRAREFLEKHVPGLRLSRGRAGRNPKYEGAQKVLAYGEVELPDEKKPKARSSTKASSSGKTKRSSKSEPAARGAAPPPPAAGAEPTPASPGGAKGKGRKPTTLEDWLKVKP